MVTFSARRPQRRSKNAPPLPPRPTSRPSRARKRLLPPPFGGPSGILVEARGKEWGTGFPAPQGVSSSIQHQTSPVTTRGQSTTSDLGRLVVVVLLVFAVLAILRERDAVLARVVAVVLVAVVLVVVWLVRLELFALVERRALRTVLPVMRDAEPIEPLAHATASLPRRMQGRDRRVLAPRRRP